VLIIGEGDIHMDSEAIDLTLRGHPKRLGFRVRSPVLVRGTLSHPSAATRPRDAVAQVAAAVALGALLTPLASALAFVEPGLSKDADCGALMTASPSSP
jgi:AsmA family protein